MEIYKEMYYKMFNAVTEAMGSCGNITAYEILRKAQLDCEEMFMSAQDDESAGQKENSPPS